MEKELPIFYMPTGKFKGEKIDNSTRRSIELVREDESFYYINYFFHNSQFYSAQIPKNAVKEIVGQRFSFGKRTPFINHAQVRFILDPGCPIKIYSLYQFEKEVLFELNDFVYSIEVVGPKGKAWSFAYAFGDFVSAHRMISVEEVVFERVVLGEYKVIQSPPLLLEDKQMQKALELVVKRANKSQMSERYYLINPWFGANNCTSELFYILDELKKDQYNLFEKFVSKLLWRLPYALRFYLKVRRVIDLNKPILLLNEEFANLAKSENMLERKTAIKDKVFIS